jgi:hypothetical protein
MKAKYVTLGCAALVVLVAVPLVIRMSRRAADGHGAMASRSATSSVAVHPEPLVPDYPREFLPVTAPTRRGASWRGWYDAWWRDIDPVGNPS